jgi:hypothetical protein
MRTERDKGGHRVSYSRIMKGFEYYIAPLGVLGRGSGYYIARSYSSVHSALYDLSSMNA